MQEYIAGPLLWEGTLLPPERPHYQSEESKQASDQGYQLDHRGWWLSPGGKLWLPKALQWKILKTLHQLFHLCLGNTLVLVNKMFEGTKLRDTAQHVVQRCETCQKTKHKNKRLQMPGAQRQWSYPREGWQLDFAQIPDGPKSKLLLVFVVTFTGWVETFPCTEHAREVVWVLITEIIPHFGLPKSHQSHNSPAFKTEVTQGLSRALGIE
jgi:hypothetical protein